MKIYSFKIKKWNDAKNIFANKPLWIFRGQSSSAWELESSLHREACRQKIDYKDLHNREAWIVNKF